LENRGKRVASLRKGIEGIGIRKNSRKNSWGRGRC